MTDKLDYSPMVGNHLSSGLINHANTCFLASATQTLVTKPSIKHLVQILSGKAKQESKLRCIRPSATRSMATTPNTSCIHLDNLVRLETAKHYHVHDAASEGVLNNGPHSSIKIRKSKLQEFVIRRYYSRLREIPRTPPQKNPSIHHPCYILDNIRTVLSFLSVLEVIRLKRISKTWKLASCSVLKMRNSDNITLSPSTAKMGGTLIQQLTLILPRLQHLTLSLNDFKDDKGPMPLFVLSCICACQDLTFLRLERYSWRQFDMAVRVIVSSIKKGHPILKFLEVLELPNASLPNPTSAQCMKPLSKLTPSLGSLMLNNAQDPLIFSLRLFMPSVKNLFLLKDLYTTQGFAVIALIIAKRPKLMKLLMNNRQENCPRTPVPTTNLAGYDTYSGNIKPTIGTPIRRLTPGSRPVTSNDERLKPLYSRHNGQLHVEPLGTVYQVETGKALSKRMLQIFASFCALIGALIIMPPFEDESSHDSAKDQEDNQDTER